MKRIAAFLVLLVLPCCEVRLAAAQNAPAPTPAEKLRAAFDATNLQANGVQPWHWKMDVTLTDAYGKHPQPGSIEAWYADGNMRSVMMLNGDQVTTVRIGTKLYRSDGDAQKFVPLDVLFAYALNPIPETLFDPSVTLKSAALKKGNAKLDCIQPVFKLLPDADVLASIAPLSYCWLAGTGTFVASYAGDDNTVARTQMGMFSGKQVPVGLQLNVLGQRSTAKTTTLETFISPPDFFALQDLKPLVSPLDIPNSGISSLQLLPIFPEYPQSARERRVDGSSQFTVIVGTNGRVVSAVLSKFDDAELAAAAKLSVMNSIYHPYLINGQAVQVKTTLFVDFHIG